MGRVKKEELKLDAFKTAEELELKELPSENNYQYNKTKEALCDLISATMEYLECKDHLEYKKASLQIHTDWSKALPYHSRPTVDDKKSYVIETTYDEKQQLRALQVDKQHKEELYKIELMRYEKQ